MTVPLILASTSPRRRELLRRIVSGFSVVSASGDEIISASDVRTVPCRNAVLKAESVFTRFPDALVIGADTVVLLDDRILGKPADREQALEYLISLSGRTHEVLTGVALRGPGCSKDWTEVTEVIFKPYTAADAVRYMELVDVSDKAGAYAIQEHGGMLLEKINGEQENVIGLPLIRLRSELCGYGIGSAPRR